MAGWQLAEYEPGQSYVFSPNMSSASYQKLHLTCCLAYLVGVGSHLIQAGMLDPTCNVGMIDTYVVD
jgi:hypothetical protein